jgi:hypothetical protein
MRTIVSTPRIRTQSETIIDLEHEDRRNTQRRLEPRMSSWIVDVDDANDNRTSSASSHHRVSDRE